MSNSELNVLFISWRTLPNNITSHNSKPSQSNVWKSLTQAHQQRCSMSIGTNSSQLRPATASCRRSLRRTLEWPQLQCWRKSEARVKMEQKDNTSEELTIWFPDTASPLLNKTFQNSCHWTNLKSQTRDQLKLTKLLQCSCNKHRKSVLSFWSKQTHSKASDVLWLYCSQSPISDNRNSSIWGRPKWADNRISNFRLNSWRKGLSTS